MVGNADVIKDAMQLGDDVIDLSGQIACIDGHGVMFVSHAQARGVVVVLWSRLARMRLFECAIEEQTRL